jgi:hypothetical protein
MGAFHGMMSFSLMIPGPKMSEDEGVPQLKFWTEWIGSESSSVERNKPDNFNFATGILCYDDLKWVKSYIIVHPTASRNCSKCFKIGVVI